MNTVKYFMNIVLIVVLFLTSYQMFSQCNIALEPTDIEEAHHLNVAFESEVMLIEKLELCLGGATPSENSICDHETEKLVNVWFLINPVNVSSGYLQTTVSTSFNVKPYWAYFTESNGVFSQDGPCNDSDVSPEVSRYIFTNEQPIYLRVSIPTDTPFDMNDILTVKSFLNPFNLEESCYNAANADGTPITTFEVEIIERSIGDIESPILLGGEELTVQINAVVATDDTGFDWVQGLIPVLGDGWDLQYFYSNEQQILNNDMTWIASESECNGTFSDDVASLCVYENEFGELILCNYFTHDCPCDKSVEQGDQLPGGFFGMTPGGGSCSFDCTPTGSYGVSREENVTIWLKLRVNPVPIHTDLTIGLQLLSDDISGCWNESNPCRFITPQLDNKFLKSNSNEPYIYSFGTSTSCSGEQVSLNILKNQLRSDSVTIKFQDNTNLNFITSSEIISIQEFFMVQIENNSNVVEEAKFSLTGHDQDGNEIVSPIYTLKILPQLVITNLEQSVCIGSCKTYTLETNYGDHSDFLVFWEDGEQGMDHIICHGETTRGIMIDRQGCDTLEFIVETDIDVSNMFDFSVPDVLCSNESYFVDIKGNGVENLTSVVWYVTIEEGTVTFEGGTTMFIDDEILINGGDSISILANIYDSTGCIHSIEVDREIVVVEDQYYAITECKTIETEILMINIPIMLNAENFIGLTLAEEMDNVTFQIDENYNLLLNIENPELGLFDFDFLANYSEECYEYIEIDLEVTDGYLGEVKTTISGLSVDFELTDIEEIQNIMWEFGDGTSSEQNNPNHEYEHSGTYQVEVTMTTECGMISRIFTVSVGTTAVVDEIVSNLVLYPNPANSTVIVSSEFPFNTIVLYDINGKLLRRDSFKDTKSHSLILDNCLDGLYMIRVIGENHEDMKSLVVIK